MLLDQSRLGRKSAEIGAGTEDLVAGAGENDGTHLLGVSGSS